MGDGPRPEFPRTFASPAFLREVEKGTFLLFRSIEIEINDPVTGTSIREKLRDMQTSPIPLREFDPKVDVEMQIVLRTSHPLDGRQMSLVEIR